MKKFMTPFVILLVMFLFYSDLTAQWGMRAARGNRMEGFFCGRIYGFLKVNQQRFKITDAQLVKIKDNMLKMDANTVKLQSKMNLDQLELNKLMLSDNKNYTKIKSIMSRMADTRSTMMIERLRNREMLKKILTAEQLAGLTEFSGRNFWGPMGRRGFGQMGGRGYGQMGRRGYGQRMQGYRSQRFLNRRGGMGRFGDWRFEDQ